MENIKGKKISSKNKEKNLFIVYRNDDKEIKIPNFNENIIILMSVDPGTRNCAIRFSRRSIEFIEDKPKEKVETLYQDLWDLNPVLGVKKRKELGCDSSVFGSSDIRIYYNLSKKLEEVKYLIEKCNFFIYERQLPLNYNATRVCHHILSFCMANCIKQNEPLFIEVQPRLKTAVLKKGDGSEIKDNKEWSKYKCKKLLEERCDNFCLESIEKIKKKDDVSDTIVQEEALVILLKEKYLNNFK